MQTSSHLSPRIPVIRSAQAPGQGWAPGKIARICYAIAIAFFAAFGAFAFFIMMSYNQHGRGHDKNEAIQTIGGLGVLSLLAAGACLYFLPSVIVLSKEHANKMAVVALNTIAGWTLLGWVFALVWALTNPPTHRVEVVEIRASR